MVPAIIEAAQSYIYTIGAGVVILLVGFGFGLLVKKLARKVLKDIELNKIMAKVGLTYNLEKGVPDIITYVIYLITVIIFLDKLLIKSVVLYLIAGAVLMLLILTFIVGLKDVIPNFVAWVLLQRKSKIREGSRVEVREIAGRVEKVGYLETEIRTDNEDILYVPNSLFMKSKFKLKN